MEQKDTMQGSGFTGAKKGYQAPRLREYGSLTELTNSTMTPTPGNDSQGKGNSGS